MRLVIDIPEEDYKFIKDLQYVILNRRTTKRVQYDVINAIRNGIPYELMAIPIKESQIQRKLPGCRRGECTECTDKHTCKFSNYYKGEEQNTRPHI